MAIPAPPTRISWSMALNTNRRSSSMARLRSVAPALASSVPLASSSSEGVMTNRMFIRLCIGLGLVLGGCTPPTSERTETESPKQLHVDYVRLRHVAAFMPGRPELAGGEAQKLATFLDSAAVGPQDHVYLESGSDDRLS